MKREIDILTTDECHSLLSACSKAPTGIRNRAMVVVLWRACLRSRKLSVFCPKMSLKIPFGCIQAKAAGREPLVSIQKLQPWYGSGSVSVRNWGSKSLNHYSAPLRATLSTHPIIGICSSGWRRKPD